MKTTKEYFGKSVDELIVTNDSGYTKEENLLFDSGLEVVFFDTESEYKSEEDELNKHAKSKRLEVKEKLKTVNGRVAVILV